MIYRVTQRKGIVKRYVAQNWYFYSMVVNVRHIQFFSIFFINLPTCLSLTFLSDCNSLNKCAAELPKF